MPWQGRRLPHLFRLRHRLDVARPDRASPGRRASGTSRTGTNCFIAPTLTWHGLRQVGQTLSFRCCRCTRFSALKYSASAASSSTLPSFSRVLAVVQVAVRD